MIYVDPLPVVSQKIWDAAASRLSDVRLEFGDMFYHWTRIARTGNANQCSYPSELARVRLQEYLGIDLPVTTTVGGWQPSCTCPAAEPVPQLVLDPFTGSGTTGAVAIRHQRSFVGCELNPAYLELARRRIGDVAPLLAREEVA